MGGASETGRRYPFGSAFVLANGPFTEREGALAVFICRISLRARSLPLINGNDMVTTKIIRSLRLAGLGLLAGGLSACYDTYNTYGSDLVEPSFRSVLVDSCTVTMTSVLIDSVETSGKEIALAGRYEHPLWGSIAARSFIAYERPS